MRFLGYIYAIKALKDLFEVVVVALVFIPEVRGEAGTDTDRRFFSLPSLH